MSSARIARPRGLLLGCLAVCLASAAGATAAERTDPADELVNEALKQEIFGDSADRTVLLKSALEKSPRHEAAHWHLGHVRQNNRWVTIDEATEQNLQDLRLVRYQKTRGDYPDTVAGQLALADWCAEQRLADEERAHLTRVLELNPEHPAARQRLGFRMVNGIWISPQEREASRERLTDTLAALRKWKGRLEGIRRGLASTSGPKQDAARQRLAEIDDASVIPALELLLAGASETCAMAAADKLATFSSLEAAQALARMAVFSPFELARFRAAQQLRDRSQDQYVPAMLSAIYTPVQARTELYRTPNGRLMYRHLFFREGQNDRQLAVLDAEYRRGVGDVGIIEGLALSHAAATAEERAQFAARQNAMTEALNGRIGEALATATGQSISQPTEWWGWWNEANEVFVENKGTRSFYQRERYTVDDPTAQSGGTGGGETGGGTSTSLPTTMDCLARGTAVWTATGPVAIEKVQIGDRVLSQDPETGELAYKPVLRTTVRPAERLLRLKLSGEYFECSGGHLFWSPGKGWIKARQLATGDRLHRPTDMVAVEGVEEGRFEPTFNLIVADFHTYFVGSNKVLSHDNTVRAATTALVPGLVAE